MRRDERSVENIFFNPFSYDSCVFISTHYNINVILVLIVMNNIKKKLVMIAVYYGNQIIVDQSTISIIINNIDYNH